MGKPYQPIKKLFLEKKLEEGSIVELVNIQEELIKRKSLVTVGRIGKRNSEMNLSFPFSDVKCSVATNYQFTIWPDGSIINPMTGKTEENFYSDYRVVERAE